MNRTRLRLNTSTLLFLCNIFVVLLLLESATKASTHGAVADLVEHHLGRELTKPSGTAAGVEEVSTSGGPGASADIRFNAFNDLLKGVKLFSTNQKMNRPDRKRFGSNRHFSAPHETRERENIMSNICLCVFPPQTSFLRT